MNRGNGDWQVWPGSAPIPHTNHPRWVTGLVGAVEYVDLDCRACTVRELRAEAAELARRLAVHDPTLFAWIDDPYRRAVARAAERRAVLARLREIEDEIDNLEHAAAVDAELEHNERSAR